MYNPENLGSLDKKIILMTKRIQAFFSSNRFSENMPTTVRSSGSLSYAYETLSYLWREKSGIFWLLSKLDLNQEVIAVAIILTSV